MDTSMKAIASRLLLVLGFACFAAGVQGQAISDPGDPVESATTTALANKFVKLVDQGKTAETWALTGPILRGMSTQPEWEAALKSMRKADAPLKARELTAALFTKVIEGAPDGHYFVVFFASTFGDSKYEEKVIYSLAKGQWKIEGYFITPMSEVMKQ